MGFRVEGFRVEGLGFGPSFICCHTSRNAETLSDGAKTVQDQHKAIETLQSPSLNTTTAP